MMTAPLTTAWDSPHLPVRKKGRQSEKEMAEQVKPEKLSLGPAHPQQDKVSPSGLAQTLLSLPVVSK